MIQSCFVFNAHPGLELALVELRKKKFMIEFGSLSNDSFAANPSILFTYVSMKRVGFELTLIESRIRFSIQRQPLVKTLTCISSASM